MTLPTLTEFFESHFMPIWIESGLLDPKTQTSYRDSLKHWQKMTDDPCLDKITDLTVAKFITGLAKLPGKRGNTLASASIKKHCRQLDTILKMAGPRSRYSQKGQGLVPEPPYFKAPKSPKVLPKPAWSMPELTAMYAAADKMTRPKSVIPSPDWWRTLVVILYFGNLRINELMNTKFSMIKGSWLDLPAEVCKGDKEARHYLRTEVLEHVEAVRTDDRELILPFASWPKSKRMAYEYLDDLQDHAGIAADRRFRFHGFRRTHISKLAGNKKEYDDNVKVAQRSASHANVSVTLDHYVDISVQEQAMMDAIDRMPSPCGVANKVERADRTRREPLRFVDRALERDFID